MFYQKFYTFRLTPFMRGSYHHYNHKISSASQRMYHQGTKNRNPIETFTGKQTLGHFQVLRTLNRGVSNQASLWSVQFHVKRFSSDTYQNGNHNEINNPELMSSKNITQGTMSEKVKAMTEEISNESNTGVRMSQKKSFNFRNIPWTNDDIFDEKDKLRQHILDLYISNNSSHAHAYLTDYYDFLAEVEEYTPEDNIYNENKEQIEKNDTPKEGSLFYKKSHGHILLDAILLSYTGHCIRMCEGREQHEQGKVIRILKKSLLYFDRCKILRQKLPEEKQKGLTALEDEIIAEFHACNTIIESYFQNEKYLGAIPFIERAIALQPNELKPKYMLACALEELGEMDKVETLYLEIAEQFKEPLVYGDIAIFFRDQKKNFEKAEYFFQEAIRLDPENINNLYQYGIFLFKDLKELDKAEKCFKKALSVNKNDDKLLESIGAVKVAKGDFEKAKTYLSKARNISPNSISIISNDALVNYLTGDLSTAESCCRHAVKIIEKVEKIREESLKDETMSKMRKRSIMEDMKSDKMNYASLYSTFANILFDTGKFEEAEQYYRKTIEIQPNNAAVLGNLALLLHQEQQKYDDAEIYYKKAAQNMKSLFSPKHPKMNPKMDIIEFNAIQTHKNNLGHYAQFMLRVRKKVKEAKRCYEKIVNLMELQNNLSFDLTPEQKEHFLNQNATFYLNYATLISKSDSVKAKQFQKLADQIKKEISQIPKSNSK